MGQEIVKQIANGETQRYQITLNERSTQIVIKPSYFDVAISVRQLDGESILRANSPPTEISDEYIIVTASTPGKYIIEIEGVSQSFSQGHYNLTVTKPTLSQNQLAAAKFTTEAAQVNINDSSADQRDALTTALGLYQKSAIAWQESGDAQQQSRSLRYSGWLARELGELETAQSNFAKALALEQESDAQHGWLHAYLGLVKLHQDQFEQAEESFRQALNFSRKANDQRGTASFLKYLGLISQYKNLPVTAADWYAQALVILEDNSYPHQEASTLNNIGGTQYQMGRFKEALGYYQRALEIYEHFKDHDEQATVLGNIASLYREQGDLGESLAYNLRTLQIYKDLGDIKSQNLAYHRLGILFQRMGDYQRSEVYFIRAFEGKKRSKSLRRAANSLRSLGAMYSENGKIDKAIENQNDALSLYTQVDSKVDIAKTQVALAGSLIKRASDQIKRKQLKNTKVLLDQALPVLKEASLLPDLADALMQLGNYNSINNNINIAKEQFNKALDIQRKISDPIGEIDALVALANLEQNPQKSLTQLHSAEVIAQKIHQGVANPALKARFSATLQKLYDRIIEDHLALHKLKPSAGHAELAFMASERNRARSLLELISNSKVAATTIQSARLEKHKELRRRLNALWFSVNRSALRANNPETKQLKASNANVIADVMSQLDSLTDQLSQTQRSGSKNDGFGLHDIQSSISSDELLLHIHMGKTKGAIWNISQNQISVKELPAREVIEEIARDAYDTLMHNKSANSDVDKLSKLTKFLIQDTTILAGKRKVYVVADGFLQYIPFGALVDETNTFLLASTTFVNLPSSRSLLHRTGAPRFNQDTSLLVYSDPVFGENDFRAQLTGDALISASELSRAANRAGIKTINRLAFSSIEADKIAAIIPSAKVISGFDANKQDVFNRNIKNTKILHFATHGVVNDDYPVLSGLILSLIDKDKNQLDGFLSAADISTLSMSPKLVVLSACETGIGEAVPGEGLLSLARAFLSQGSENVVSSLWQVDDQATAELMGHFYHALIERQDSIAQALRYAQQKIARQPKWRAPYYWAGFITSSVNPSTDELSIEQ